MKKAIWGIVIGLVVIAACFVVIFTRNQKQTVTKQGKQQDQVGLSIKKTKHNKQSNNSTQNDNQDSDEQYSTDEWMLMGYMAYCHDNYVQSRHIKNNAELVDDVSEDLGDGSLKAVKNSSNSYTLTNKFGSVDVDVEDDDVKVTGDGDTVNAKSELKNKFGAYADKVKAMTRNISNGGNTEEKTTDSNKNNETQAFTSEELVIAAMVNKASGSTPISKIQIIENTLQKDKSRNKNDFPSDDYITGIYKHGSHWDIAYNFSTSNFVEFYLNGNSDQMKIKAGGAGRESMPAKYESKKDLVKKYGPYKSEINQILQGIKYNRNQMDEVRKMLFN